MTDPLQIALHDMPATFYVSMFTDQLLKSATQTTCVEIADFLDQQLSIRTIAMSTDADGWPLWTKTDPSE